MTPVHFDKNKFMLIMNTKDMTGVLRNRAQHLSDRISKISEDNSLNAKSSSMSQ